MSYIRALSNPEGLYIYGDERGKIHVCHCVRPPLSSPWRKVGPREVAGIKLRADTLPPIITVPRHVFDHVAMKWGEGFVDSVRYRGLVVREEHVYVDTGKLVGNQSIRQIVELKREGRFAIRFEYKGTWFYMWRVTWEHVVANVAARYPKRRR